MQMTYDFFDRPESPALTLCHVNGRQIGVLGGCTNLHLIPRLNDVSELSFDMARRGDADTLYPWVQEYRQVLVEGVGYFILTSVIETTQAGHAQKAVRAQSCEIELAHIKLPYIQGTYVFYSTQHDADGEPLGLINRILTRMPKWTLRHVDAAIQRKYRTFDVPIVSVYNFLINDMADAYECYFRFDAVERCIDVLPIEAVIRQTSIHLAQQNLLNQVEIESQSDNIATALLVTGGDDLDITAVNPLGGNVLYNFQYFLTDAWMTPALIERVEAWQQAIDAQQPLFTRRLGDMQTLQADITALLSDRTLLQSRLDGLEKAKDACIIANMSTQDVVENARLNQEIIDLQEQIRSTDAAVQTKTSQFDTLAAEQKALTDSIRMQRFFTEEELTELSGYLFESAFQDTTIIPTDSDDYAVEQGYDNAYQFNIARANELYAKARQILKRVSLPHYRIRVDSRDFVFQKAFAAFTAQLEIGCLIHVEVRDEDFAELVLVQMDLDYDTQSLTMEFSNQTQSADPRDLLNDLFDKTTRTANTLDYQKKDYLYAKSHGRLDDVVRFASQALDLTKNAVLSADGQEIVLDSHGYHGRAQDAAAENGYSPKELRIVNNALAFSDDGFQTSKLALGDIRMPDGSSRYGLVADFLYGNLLAGENLTIRTPNEEFVIDQDGVRSTTLLSTAYFNDLLEQINEQNTATLDISANQILTSVEQIYTKQTDTDNLREELQAIIEHSAEDIVFRFNDLKVQTEQIGDSLQQQKDELSTHIRFTASGIELGRTDSTLIARLGNDRLSFLEDGQEVAYISNNKLYITQGEILTNLALGNFEFAPRANGNLSLKWKG